MLVKGDSVLCISNENVADLLEINAEYTIEAVTHEGLVALVGIEGFFCDWRFCEKTLLEEPHH